MRKDRLRSLAGIAAALLLVTGCQGSPATSTPTDGRSPVASAPLPTQSLPAPSSTPSEVGGRWEAAGTMAIARAATHAVRLGDGRVLVVGSEGYEGSADSAKAEVWEPATGAWHTTESLNKPRADFAAVPLADGRVLVTGGRNQVDESFSSTYVYDPRPGNETWAKVGLLGNARTGAIAAVLPDGRVLVAGGYFRKKPTYGRAAPGTVLAVYRPASPRETGSSGPRLADVEPPNIGSALATAELFDPTTGSWSATGPLKNARFGAAAVTLADGRVLVVGSGGSSSGVTVDDRATDSAEIYDAETGRFSLVGGLPNIDRSALEKLGVPGANTVPEYGPEPAETGTLVALNDGGAVLVGHAGWWKHVGDITRSFRFEASTGGWTEIGQTYVYIGEPTAVPLVTLGVRRLAGAMVARLPDGRVLVAGGAGAIPEGSPYSSTYTSASADLYDPTTDTWSPLPPMPEARAGGAPVVLTDGSVLLVGGYSDPTDDEHIDFTSAIRFVPSP